MENPDEKPFAFRKGHWVRVTNEDHEFYNEDFIVIGMLALEEKLVVEKMYSPVRVGTIAISDVRHLHEFQDPKTLRAK